MDETPTHNLTIDQIGFRGKLFSLAEEEEFSDPVKKRNSELDKLEASGIIEELNVK